MTKLLAVGVLLLCAGVYPARAVETDPPALSPPALEENRVPRPPPVVGCPTPPPWPHRQHVSLHPTTEQKIESRMFLNPGEGKRFDELFGKATHTPAEAEEMEALMQIGRYWRVEYLSLVAKPQRTDADIARMKDIEALAISNAPAVRELQRGPSVVEGRRFVEPVLGPVAGPVKTPEGEAARLYATLVEQNKRLIEQNERIIALLTQLAARPISAPTPDRPQVWPADE